MSSIIWTLWTSFFKMGLFSIGGGYAIIPFIQEEVVNSRNWLSIQEYTDIITISQMTPGPLVVNTASFVGIRIAGLLGAAAATIGSILSGFVISILLYNFFKKHRDNNSISNVLKGLRATSAGLIGSSASTIILLAFFRVPSLNIAEMNLNAIAIIVFVLALFLLRKYRLNPILVMVMSGIIGLFFY